MKSGIENPSKSEYIVRCGGDEKMRSMSKGDHQYVIYRMDRLFYYRKGGVCHNAWLDNNI